MESDEELFQPTLKNNVNQSGNKPTSLNSQLWVGLLGGPISWLYITLENSKRLNLPKEARSSILKIGILAFLACLFAAYFIPTRFMGVPNEFGQIREVAAGSEIRTVVRIITVIAYFFAKKLQEQPMRIYRVRTEDDMGSPWGIGFLSVILFGIIYSVLMYIGLNLLVNIF